MKLKLFSLCLGLSLVCGAGVPSVDAEVVIPGSGEAIAGAEEQIANIFSDDPDTTLSGKVRAYTRTNTHFYNLLGAASDCPPGWSIYRTSLKEQFFRGRDYMLFLEKSQWQENVTATVDQSQSFAFDGIERIRPPESILVH